MNNNFTTTVNKYRDLYGEVEKKYVDMIVFVIFIYCCCYWLEICFSVPKEDRFLVLQFRIQKKPLIEPNVNLSIITL